MRFALDWSHKLKPPFSLPALQPTNHFHLFYAHHCFRCFLNVEALVSYISNLLQSTVSFFSPGYSCLHNMCISNWMVTAEPSTLCSPISRPKTWSPLCPDANPQSGPQLPVVSMSESKHIYSQHKCAQMNRFIQGILLHKIVKSVLNDFPVDNNGEHKKG